MKTYRVKVRDRSFKVRAKDENEAFTKVKEKLIKDGNYTITYEDMNTDEQGTAKLTAGDIKQAFVEFEKYLKKNGMGVDSTYVVSVSPDDGNKGIKGSLRAINARIRYKV